MEKNCQFTLQFPSDVAKEHEALGSCVLVDQRRQYYCLDDEAGWVATLVATKVQ